jgi:hypothetical protein
MIAGGEDAMVQVSHRERLLRSIEDEISLMECLVGHFAAAAALGSAKRLPRQVAGARRTLATAAETLGKLHGLESRLRRAPAPDPA